MEYIKKIRLSLPLPHSPSLSPPLSPSSSSLSLHSPSSPRSTIGCSFCSLPLTPEDLHSMHRQRTNWQPNRKRRGGGGRRRARGAGNAWAREGEWTEGILSDISYIPPYTFIYLYIPSYTFIYLHIPPNSVVYLHIPPYTSKYSMLQN